MERWARRAATWLLVFVTLMLASADGASAAKRVAVLHIEDDSGFDPPSGCGCLPLGPLGSIFGRTKRQREYWNLEVGFRDMLATTFRDALGYEPVYAEEVMAAYGGLGLSAESMEAEESRGRLTQALGADVLVIGKIRKFKQERAEGILRRDISTAGGTDRLPAAAGMIGVRGSYYDASVAMEFTVFGRGGAEAYRSEASDSQSFQTGAVKSGPLSASVSGAGAEAFIGSQRVVAPSVRAPVVRYEILDHVRFGVPGWDRPTEPKRPPNFRETLLGRATQKAMDDFVADMRERIGPTLEESEPQEERSAVGKVAFAVEEDGSIYVNLGSQAQLRVGDRLQLSRSTQAIRDPDTGELLGQLDEVVGVLEVVEVMRPKLSRTRVVDGDAQVGDGVELLPVVEDPPPDGAQVHPSSDAAE